MLQEPMSYVPSSFAARMIYAVVGGSGISYFTGPYGGELLRFLYNSYYLYVYGPPGYLASVSYYWKLGQVTNFGYTHGDKIFGFFVAVMAYMLPELCTLGQHLGHKLYSRVTGKPIEEPHELRLFEKDKLLKLVESLHNIASSKQQPMTDPEIREFANIFTNQFRKMNSSKASMETGVNTLAEGIKTANVIRKQPHRRCKSQELPVKPNILKG